MKLSIIILNYKTVDLVKYCIKNIKATVRDVPYEIIVVDNASYDGIKKMLDTHYPDIRFIQSPENGGFSKGNNIGIREARGEYIMIMNPDITVKPGAIHEVVQYMDTHPDVGMVGPKLLNPNETLQRTFSRFQTWTTIVCRRTPLGQTRWGHQLLHEYQYRDADLSSPLEVDWVMGACQTVRRKDLDVVGMYDEMFFFYVEDMEWCRRMWMHGKKVVWLPSAQMYHLHEQASMTTPWGFLKFNKFVRWHIVSFLKYKLKYRKIT
jgi:GT2 family glycosyltransferase